MIPLAKPGKDPCHATSYRPISLLSPAVKILEKLILPFLTAATPPANHQHGFRKEHSTTTALFELSSDITDGLNAKKPALRTVIVTLDLTRAFDFVDTATLLQNLADSSLDRGITRCLAAYLRGRQSKVSFRENWSKTRVQRCGVPQGGVLSPALFNAYLSSLPQPAEPVKIISYADDIMVYSQHHRPSTAANNIQQYLQDLCNSLSARGLTISTSKSTNHFGY